MSSGLRLPLQVLIHLLSVSRTVFPPQDLVPDILLPETLHSLPPSLDQLLLIPPFQFRPNFHHRLSIRLPNGLRQAYPHAMYHKVLRVIFLKGKSDHGTVKSQWHTNSLKSHRTVWFGHSPHFSVHCLPFSFTNTPHVCSCYSLHAERASPGRLHRAYISFRSQCKSTAHPQRGLP